MFLDSPQAARGAGGPVDNPSIPSSHSVCRDTFFCDCFSSAKSRLQQELSDLLIQVLLVWFGFFVVFWFWLGFFLNEQIQDG